MVNCVGTKKTTRPNQQQGISSYTQEPSRCLTLRSNLIAYFKWLQKQFSYIVILVSSHEIKR
jgi:hypothetical protein